MKKKTIGIILIATLIIAAAIGWCLWRQHELATPQPTHTAAVAATPSPHVEDTAEPSKGENEDVLLQRAVAFEQAARTWGIDPDIDLQSIAGQDGATVAKQLHTEIPAQNPISESVAFDISPKAGPDGPSEFCKNDMEMLCGVNPTMRQWWPNEAWSWGSKWVQGPQASANEDGTITVTGTVRFMLLQDGEQFSGNGYTGITPAWQDYDIKDVLTFNDEGKITNIDYRGRNNWWINPWLMQWNAKAPESIAPTARRICIPVKGDSHIELNHMVGARRLAVPQTKLDLDGNVDFSLWDGLLSYNG